MKAKKSLKPEKFDLKNTGPFSPAEATQRLMLASKQLKGFQLWHPHLHVAHETFSLEKVRYPIPKNTIPKGIVISRLEGIRSDCPPPRCANGFIRPFRHAQKALAHTANISMAIVFYETTSKNCPVGVHSLSLLADQGKGLRLQAYYLHDTPTPPTTPAVVRKQVTKTLGLLARDRWNLLTDEDYIVFPRNVRRAQSTMEISFPPGAFDELENILAELLKTHGQPKKASWWVNFVDHLRGGEVFYRRISDDEGRWFHFPRPEVLKATGLKGNAAELIKLVNEAGFPGATANLSFEASFEQLKDVQAFFELAVRSEEIDRAALAMLQTEQGVLAQLCFGTNRAGKIILKVLYPQRGGFGWENAYEKLLRGEKLIPEGACQ